MKATRTIFVMSLLGFTGCVVEAGNASTGTAKSGGSSSSPKGQVAIHVADDAVKQGRQVFLQVTGITLIGASGYPNSMVDPALVPKQLPLGLSSSEWIAKANLTSGKYSALELTLDPTSPGTVVDQGVTRPLTLSGGKHILQSPVDLSVPSDNAAVQQLTLKFFSQRGLSPLDNAFQLSPELLVLPGNDVAMINGSTNRQEDGMACAYLFAPTVSLPTAKAVPAFNLTSLAPSPAWADNIADLTVNLASSLPIVGGLFSALDPNSQNNDPTEPYVCGLSSMTKAEAIELMRKVPLMIPVCHPSVIAAITGQAPAPASPRSAPKLSFLSAPSNEPAIATVPAYAASREQVVLDKTPDCPNAFQIAPIVAGRFSMQVVPGSLLMRFFFAPNAVVDLPSAVTAVSGTPAEVVVP